MVVGYLEKLSKRVNMLIFSHKNQIQNSEEKHEFFFECSSNMILLTLQPHPLRQSGSAIQKRTFFEIVQMVSMKNVKKPPPLCQI